MQAGMKCEGGGRFPDKLRLSLCAHFSPWTCRLHLYRQICKMPFIYSNSLIIMGYALSYLTLTVMKSSYSSIGPFLNACICLLFLCSFFIFSFLSSFIFRCFLHKT